MREDLAEKIQAALRIVRRAAAHIEALSNLPGSALQGFSVRDMAERFYLERRKRDEHFPSGLFGEPAWDLLLALFVARQDGRSLTLPEASEAARVSLSSGRRLIARMEGEGLIERSGAHRSRGRTVQLTAQTLDRLSDYLLACLAERTKEGF